VKWTAIDNLETKLATFCKPMEFHEQRSLVHMHEREREREMRERERER
jgi:hypothetical protein